MTSKKKSSTKSMNSAKSPAESTKLKTKNEDQDVNEDTQTDDTELDILNDADETDTGETDQYSTQDQDEVEDYETGAANVRNPRVNAGQAKYKRSNFETYGHDEASVARDRGDDNISSNRARSSQYDYDTRIAYDRPVARPMSEQRRGYSQSQRDRYDDEYNQDRQGRYRGYNSDRYLADDYEDRYYPRSRNRSVEDELRGQGGAPMSNYEREEYPARRNSYSRYSDDNYQPRRDLQSQRQRENDDNRGYQQRPHQRRREW